ncbi:MAG: hypothetical protein MUE85_07180 [Microscillaceae bacterium]|jgi:hypothetical protein|nr:hypothetical protein [Microscillaceae bacterium]
MKKVSFMLFYLVLAFNISLKAQSNELGTIIVSSSTIPTSLASLPAKSGVYLKFNTKAVGARQEITFTDVKNIQSLSIYVNPIELDKANLKILTHNLSTGFKIYAYISTGQALTGYNIIPLNSGKKITNAAQEIIAIIDDIAFSNPNEHYKSVSTNNTQQKTPTQAESYSFKIPPGPISTTDVEVKKGQKIDLQGGGSIYLGFTVGNSGPEGLSINSPYILYRDFRYGSLIMRIGSDGDWVEVGRQNSFVADKNGNLQFRVNDQDVGTSRGFYTIDIKVY